jgi:2-polyprenyl-6-methoxyphenol hydroxylase-like FAD-dependent oxidoreductase
MNLTLPSVNVRGVDVAAEEGTVDNITDDDRYDVAVIGYGPVGMAAAALIWRLGHRVVVLERYEGKYNLPRAAIFDDETMRTFAMLGVPDRLLPKLHVQRNYEWMNGAGDLLIEVDFAEVGRSGWAEWYMMYQPDLEDALDAYCQHSGEVDVCFGARVIGIEQSEATVSVTVDGWDRPVLARFAVACDGGNSFVRHALAIPERDYGFSEPWLVCDFRFRRPVRVPAARQVCDPVQPTSIISLGPDHHRFSFMLDSEASFMIEREPERVWRRVAPYLTREDAELIRAATYTFRSRVAERWRDGRVLLAGDAAHQMPPFLGQGMCSGVRDALNLSFKLDLVLSGVQPESLLDTFQSERDPHVRAVIAKGIELGRVQTVRDPGLAAQRDARLIAGRGTAPAKISFPPLNAGMLGSGHGAGELFVQGMVSSGSSTGRFDEVAGYGWIVLVRARLMPEIDTLADRSAVRVIGVSDVAGLPGVMHDIDGVYTTWLDQHHSDAVAIRPDFHVWGTSSGRDARRLIAEFAALLARPHSTSARRNLPR